MSVISRWITMLTGRGTRSRQVGSEEVGFCEQMEDEEVLRDNVEDEDYYSRISRLDKRQLLLSVDEFAAKYNMHDIRELLRKGALVSYSADNFWLVEGLNHEEVAALSSESIEARRWIYGNQDIPDTSALLAYYLGAIALGQGNFLIIADMAQDQLGGQSAWQIKVMEHAPTVAFAFIGCWWTELLNRRLGRCGAIMASMALNIVASLFRIESSWRWLLVSRLLHGIAAGVLICTFAVYVAEISTSRSRGRAIAWFQMLIVASYTFSTQLLPYVSSPTSLAVVTNAVAVLFALVFILKSVESPHWLVLNGRISQAYASLCRLRRTEVQAARDLYNIYIQTLPEQESYRYTEFTGRLCQLFTLPKLRRVLLSSVIVNIYPLLAGVQIVPVESLVWRIKSLVTDSHFTINPFIIYIGILSTACIIFGLRVFATYAIDSSGRRGLLMKTMPHLLWPLLLAGLLGTFTHKDDADFFSRTILQIIFWVILAVGDCIPLTYLAEVFPLSHRDLGASLSLSALYALGLITEAVSATSWKSWFLHPTMMAGFAILTVLMIYLFIRETRHYPLVEIHTVFQTSTRNLVSYRLFVELPYVFNRYILRKDVTLEPFEESKYSVGMIVLGDANASSTS